MASNTTKRRRGKRVAQVPGRYLKVRPITIQAVSWDATRDPHNLANHWINADSKNIDASLSPDVRATLRDRARYEVANNCYAFGAGTTIANAVVGSGVRLQIIETEESGYKPDFARTCERAFDYWQQEIRLAEKLRAMRFSRFQDGEAFGVLYTNQNLISEVKLDLFPIDCERVMSKDSMNPDPYDIDGIKIDEWGNPISYNVRNLHPGAEEPGEDKFTEYPANQVVHWFRRVSSEQKRGSSELAPALNLFALLRRYTESVVTAAETAADLAMVFHTDIIEDTFNNSYSPSKERGSTESQEMFAEVPFRRGMSLVLPEGWKPAQIKAEQPTTTYPDFKRELLGEIGRALQIPFNILAGDSAKHNYASGRLDHQEYQKNIRLDQALCKASVLMPIFRAWFDEWSIVAGYRRAEDEPYPHCQWYFDGFEHVDPVKEAEAQAIRLLSGTTNLMIECGKAGYDWEEITMQAAKERELRESLGLIFDTSKLKKESKDKEDEEKE